MAHFLEENVPKKYGTWGDKNGRSDQIFTSLRRSKVMRSGVRGHYGYPDFPPDRAVGGSFHLDYAETYYGSAQVGTGYAYGPYTGYTYQGGLFVDSAMAGLPWPPDSLDVLNAWGPKAYNKLKPAKPSMQALNAIFELKDLPGMLRQRMSGSGLKDISNYWLGLQFGWKPLLNDIANMYVTQRQMQDRLKQLIRDNGRPVRRRTKDPLYENSTSVVISDGTDDSAIYPFLPYFFTRSHRRTITVTQSETVWASARFRYWLPPGPRDINWTNRMKAAIFGLNPSPSVVYNAIPWTWLIDWFTTAGDCIANMDAGVADRLAADYFYVMREIKSQRVTQATCWYRDASGTEVSATGTSHAISGSKMRGEGDPFGWHSNPSNLNAMQLSILGALGVSKLT